MTFLTAFPAALPAADIFDTGAALANRGVQLLLAAAAAVIAWFLVKALAKAGTFLAAGLAILTAIALFWALSNVTNPAIRKPLDDTVKTTLNGMAPPAGHTITITDRAGT